MRLRRAHPDLTSETPFANVAAPDRELADYDLVPPAQSEVRAMFTRATLNEMWRDHERAHRRHSFEKRRI